MYVGIIGNQGTVHAWVDYLDSYTRTPEDITFKQIKH